MTLTPEAGPALEEAESRVPRLLDRASGALTAAERRTLTRLMGKILDVDRAQPPPRNRSLGTTAASVTAPATGPPHGAPTTPGRGSAAVR